jgi:hypothetical protein
MSESNFFATSNPYMLGRSIGGNARLCLVGTPFMQSPCRSKKWSWDCQASRRTLSQASNRTWEDRLILKNAQNNIPPHIASLVGRDLHLINSHPLAIIKQKIVKASYFPGFSPGFRGMRTHPQMLPREKKHPVYHHNEIWTIY